MTKTHDSCPPPHTAIQLHEVLLQEQMEAARLAGEAARREKRLRERQEMAAAYQEQVSRDMMT